MIKVTKHTRDLLLDISKDKKIFLEGNILKVISSDDEEFNKYLQVCKDKDIETRRKRLAVTKDVQRKNKELENALEDLKESKEDAIRLKEEAERAKEIAEEDLNLLQQKTQTELMGNIVRVALLVIVGVGITTTIMYLIAIMANKETQVIGSTWSNLTGILLTNAFSIVGTIMGVKHATNLEKK
jgi:Fe2+ transport system protein B